METLSTYDYPYRISGRIIWKHVCRKRLIGSWCYLLYGCKGLSKAVKVRYEKGVLKPLEPLDLREGEERIAVLVPVGEERKKILQRYRGILGKASEEEIEKLLAEAEWEPL